MVSVDPYHGILFGNTKEQIIDTYNNLCESQRHFSELKKQISNGSVLYVSTYKHSLKIKI